MSADGYADLKRAKELLGHSIPDGDTVEVIERALRTLVEDLEKSRRAKASRPPTSVRPSKRRHIPAATRREVFARAGEQQPATTSLLAAPFLISLSDETLPVATTSQTATTQSLALARARPRAPRSPQ